MLKFSVLPASSPYHHLFLSEACKKLIRRHRIPFLTFSESHQSISANP